MANNTNWMLVLGIGVLAYFLLSNTNPFSSTGTGTAPPDTGDLNLNLPDVDTCDSLTSPDFTLNTIDKMSSGTTLTEADSVVYAMKNGALAWNPLTPGTAEADLAKRATYFVVVGAIRNTTEIGNWSYGPAFEYTVPCEPNPSKTIEVYQNAENLTITAFNDAGTAAGTTSLGASSTAVISLRVRANVSNFYFGNPYIVDDTTFTGTTGGRSKYPNVMCLDINGTSMDKPDSVKIRDGDVLNLVSTPLRFSSNGGDQGLLTTRYVSAYQAYCYEAPIFDGTGKYIEISLNSDDSVDPVDQGNVTSVEAYFYAANWFVDADTGLVKWGVEDEDGNPVQGLPIRAQFSGGNITIS